MVKRRGMLALLLGLLFLEACASGGGSSSGQGQYYPGQSYRLGTNRHGGERGGGRG